MFKVTKLLTSQFCGLPIMQKVLMSLSLTKSLTEVQPRFLKMNRLFVDSLCSVKKLKKTNDFIMIIWKNVMKITEQLGKTGD